MGAQVKMLSRTTICSTAILLAIVGTASGASTCVKTGCVAGYTWDPAAETCTADAVTPVTTGVTPDPEDPPSIAGNAAAISALAKDADNTWLLTSGFLVFFMQSGFALLEVGCVSVRNTQNILFKNMIDPTIAVIIFWGVGFPIAMGEGGGFIGSLDSTSFTVGIDNDMTPNENTCASPACADIDLTIYTVTDSCGALAPCTEACAAADADCVFTEVETDGYHDSHWATFFFQWAFCATAATIVSGAVAERILFKVYAIVTLVLTGFIYPVVVHWGWGGDGWASAWYSNVHVDGVFGVGVIDFAGSGVVHMTGGVAALVVCWWIGPRHGRFVKHFQMDGHWYAKTIDQPMISPTEDKWMEILIDEASPSGETWQTVKPEVESDLTAQEASLPTRWKANPFPASSTTFQVFGVLILWFGWYGFNCGSTLAISGGYSHVGAKVAVTTTLGAAGGGLSSFFITYMMTGVQDLGAIGNGVLAGLVSITAPCPVVEPWAALLIGIIGGAIYYGSCSLLEKLRIDDVVSASPVHMFCGMWGVLTPGLFATQKNWAVAYATMGGATEESCLPEFTDECAVAAEPTFSCTYTPGDASSCAPTDGLTLVGTFTNACVYTAAGDPLPTSTNDAGVEVEDAIPCGIFYGCPNAGSQLMAQIVFVLAILAWVGGTVSLLCFTMKMVLTKTTGFTPTEDHTNVLSFNKAGQMVGMDQMKHGGLSSPEIVSAFTGQGVQTWQGVPSSPSRTVVKQAFPTGADAPFKTWSNVAPPSP
jgi:ammonia channel protein AmtB